MKEGKLLKQVNSSGSVDFNRRNKVHNEQENKCPALA